LWIYFGGHFGWSMNPEEEEKAMSQRFDVGQVSPEGMKAMLGLAAFVKQSGLERSLLELIKIRISQINGCAYCIAMHVPLARSLGVSDERMHLLSAWREAPIYSGRERAALAWVEALVLLKDGDVSEEAYEEARKHFSVGEIANLSFAVVEISGWNRLMIASRTPPQVEQA
jgi:AhpD family alkylhydroperoxidase